MESEYYNPWIEGMELVLKNSEIGCMKLDKTIHELKVWNWY
jgi:hypothetical protein